MRASTNTIPPYSPPAVCGTSKEAINASSRLERPSGPTGKRWRVAVMAALACLAGSAQAAISVPPASPITLDTAPDVADWSTTGGVRGAGNTELTAAALDAAVEAVPASTINEAMATDSAYNTHGHAYWNSTALTIFTRPTGDAYSQFMATLRNGTGGGATKLTISYDLGTGNQPSQTEEIPGWRVFYSLTGDANSWVLIPELTGITTAGRLSVTVDLAGTWGAGANLYVLWVDDNGDGFTDAYCSIDNVIFDATGGP